MPKFLNRAELYRMLQRELPRDLQPDGAPSAFFSNASLDAKAKVLETCYLQDSAIYDNIFPASATDLINDWEITIFNQLSPADLTLEERRAKLLEQIRSQKRIRKVDIEDTIRVSLGATADFQVIEFCGASGSWIIGVSLLGDSTFLGLHSLVAYTGNNLNCALVNGSFPEVTEEEEEEMRAQAFSYEVRIYNQVLTLLERDTLEADLLFAEPARSGHTITDGLTDLDKIGV